MCIAPVIFSAALIYTGHVQQSAQMRKSGARRPSPIARIRVIRINLAAFGWKPRPTSIENNGEFGPQLATDSEDRVLVSFVTRGPIRLTRRGNPHLRFHVLRFARNGKPDLSLSIPTDHWWSNGLYIDNHDKIIVQAGGKLKLLVSPPNHFNGSGLWKTLTSCGSNCWVVESHSRRTFYVDQQTDSDNGQQLILLDRDHPTEVSYCNLPSWIPVDSRGEFGITDHFAYWNDTHGNPPMPPPVFYRWPLCHYTKRTTLPIQYRGLAMTVLGNHSLILTRSQGEVIFYNSQGKVLRKLHLRLGKHEGAVVKISQNGARLAALGMTQCRCSWLPDATVRLTAERIIMVSLKSGQQLASIPDVHLTWSPEMVISPNGKRVAVLQQTTKKADLTIVTVR